MTMDIRMKITGLHDVALETVFWQTVKILLCLISNYKMNINHPSKYQSCIKQEWAWFSLCVHNITFYFDTPVSNTRLFDNTSLISDNVIAANVYLMVVHDELWWTVSFNLFKIQDCCSMWNWRPSPIIENMDGMK